MGEPINVRGVDHGLWRELRAVAVRRGVPVGTLLNEIIRDWLLHQPPATPAP